ncbi:MAG: pilus assembly protein PilM [Candidatus Hydrogenedentes bacterium]|nr:pilus assembly protein PilM [Candidatus Hydrogenedentota bacterium]
MARKITYTGILQTDAHSISMLRFHLVGTSLEETTFMHVSGDWNDAEAQQQALCNFIETHDLGQDTIYSILPKYDITTRIITLPSDDAKEIAGMVRFSAEEYVPFTMDEVIIDQCILRTMDSGESETLIAIAHRDVVNNHLKLLRGAGIAPEKILLSTACIYSAALATQKKKSERYALVSLAAGGIEITIIDGENPVFTRGIAMIQDWQKIAEDPDVGGESLVDMGGAEDLATELRGSLSAYQRETPAGEDVKTIYLACAYAPMDKLCESLSLKMNRECQPATFVLEALDGSESVLPGVPVEAVGGLIEARGQAKVKINLLPEQEAEARRIGHVKNWTMRIALGAAVILFCLGLLYFQATLQRGSIIKDLEERIAVIAPNVRGVSEKRKQLTILRRQVNRKGSILEQLARLVDAAPEGRLNFTRLSLRRGDGIDIWGRAMTVIDISEFTTNLRRLAAPKYKNWHLEFFKSAQMVYEQQTMEYNQPVSSFQVVVPRLEDENDF